MPTIKAKPLPDFSQEYAVAFWRKMHIGNDSECWAWIKGFFASGYGRTSLNGRMFRSSRLAFMFFYGADPYPCLVLHSCDNPPCCNPNHLFLGNETDNNDDMTRKGRRPAGLTHGMAKMTPASVAELRTLYDRGATTVELVERFGISSAQVYKIATRQFWK
jgi:hypothetical protein